MIAFSQRNTEKKRQQTHLDPAISLSTETEERKTPTRHITSGLWNLIILISNKRGENAAAAKVKLRIFFLSHPPRPLYFLAFVVLGNQQLDDT